MRIKRFIAVFGALAMFFAGCEKTGVDTAYPEFDRNAMKDLFVTVEGTKVMSSAEITFPSGEKHYFSYRI